MSRYLTFLLTSLFISLVVFAWQNPSAPPPSGGGVLQTPPGQLLITTTTIFTSGNVGIGTTNPAQKLHVVTTDGVIFEKSGTPPRILLQKTGGIAWQIGTSGSIGVDDFSISNSQVYEIITFKSAGNVGIGTTAVGPERVRIEATGGAGTGIKIVGSDAERMRIVGRPTDNQSVIRFFNNAETAQVFLQSDGTSLAIMNGNVGIGTTNPGAKLHVVGGPILGQGLTEIAYNAPTNPNNAEFLTYNYSGTNWAGIGGYTNGAIWFRAQDFVFWTPSVNTNPYNVMVFNSAGNVGIGTTNPGAKLDVVGNIMLGPQPSGITFKTTGNDPGRIEHLEPTIDQGQLRISIGDDGQSTDNIAFGYYYYVDGSWQEKMRIRMDGNVGIGTTNPGYKLHTEGAGYFSGRLYVGPTTGLINLGTSISNDGGLSGFGINFERDSGHRAYGFFRENGAWTYPYPDLVWGAHTGAKIVAHGGYGGVAILEDYNWGTANWWHWGGPGTEIARFRHNNYGGSYLLSNVGIGTTNPGSGFFNLNRPSLDVTGFIGFNRDHSWDADAYARWMVFRKLRLTSSPYIEIQAEDGNLYGISVWLSSVNTKKNITNLEIDSDRIYNLRPVSFNWKNQKDNEQKTFGLIAEEVEKVIPELVSYDQNNKPLAVNYPLLSVLILDQLQKIKEALGLVIENGVVKVKEIVIDKITAKNIKIEQIEMVDRLNGDLYCIWIENGEFKKFKGECQK